MFQVYTGPLHPELFDILAMRKIEREDYELTVRITRTGHAIYWENRDVWLTEVAVAELKVSGTVLSTKRFLTPLILTPNS